LILKNIKWKIFPMDQSDSEYPGLSKHSRRKPRQKTKRTLNLDIFSVFKYTF
jgi:hypothetical protein